MNFLHNHKGLIEASLVAVGYTGITLSQIDTIGKIVASCVTIGYFVWKWRTEYKAKNEQK